MHHHAKIQRLGEIINQEKLNKKKRAYLFGLLNESHQKLLEEYIQKKRPKKVQEVVYDSPIQNKIITIFDEPQFTAELAVQLSRKYPNHRIALLDTDRLMPSLEVYLNVNTYVKSVYSQLSLSQSTGINLLIDGHYKQLLSRKYLDHVAIKSHKIRNLFFFSGSYRLDDYEYFRLDAFNEVIKVLRLHYDLVILNTNAFIYDAFTCVGLMESDLNIIPLKGRLPELKCMKRQMDFLSVKQDLTEHKTWYVLFNHQKNQMNNKLFKEMVQGYYLGNISYNKIRDSALIHHYPLTKIGNSNTKKQWEKLIYKMMKEVNRNESCK
ncbi:MAG: hypothetical protein JXR88_05565 [Clostridia bacterium]|nr:hypothetical protein [Clostridia bacterium]